MNRVLLDDFKPAFSGLDLTNGEVGKKTGDIFDLAHAFLCIDSMTHKKLQKLCYYAKAWYLAINDTNLIPEPFEAWVHGAVQPELYQEYKIYGFGYIPLYKNTQSIPEEFLTFAKEIYDSYGDLSGDELEQLNHSEMPWKKARKDLKPWQGCNTIIDEDDMKIFYRMLMENEE
ncbi:Panacea domain-containing protein [Hungatella hathewayi]|uniref:Panacea domain-containing protein n=1 Tax=Hungatella hathewayi TaxID=154046 RepID=UPI0035665DFD